MPTPELQQLLNLFQARRFDAMEQLASRLLQRTPADGFVWKALGIALQAQGRDAVPALQRAVDLLQGDAETLTSLVQAHLSRGHVLMKAGRPKDAAGSYQTAQQLDRSHPHAHACLGVALQAIGELDAAVGNFIEAVRLRPGLVDAQFCLGSCLLTLGRAEEALHSMDRVLDLRGDHAPAHANRGNALKALGRLDEALPAYRRATLLQPDLPLNHANLGAAFRELGQMEEALDCYQRMLDLDPNDLSAASDRLFIQDYLPDAAPSMRNTEAQRFGLLAAARARPFTAWADASAGSGDAMRVGFVSADLRDHPVRYFIEGVLAALARSFANDIEVFVYSNSALEDASTNRLRAHCRQWTSIVDMGDEAAARLIHDDAVHVLVDLSGHTAGNRLPLFAWRPAPVQVSWLGYCASTGLAAIDAFLADPWIVPVGADTEFTEPVWRMPETFLCFTPPRVDAAVGPLPASTQGHITFGCFNKLNKLGDEVIATWTRLLSAVPGSRLFLKSGLLGMAWCDELLRNRFAIHGIDADRLILEGASPREDYLRAYGRVDIALDPFPYPGGTTSVEGLWMGVPVLTLAGSSALARQGASILQNVGLPDWIATDPHDYIARAVRHARDIGALTALRKELRARLLASSLCDSERFAGHFVAALRELSARQ